MRRIKVKMEQLTAWKVTVFGVFLVLIFPYLVQMRENTTKKTPNTDTFCAVRFGVTYHPLLNSFNDIVRKNTSLLNIDQKVKKVFSSQPIVSFRSSRKFSSDLARAELYPLERRMGSYKCCCNRRQVSPSVIKTDNFVCKND